MDTRLPKQPLARSALMMASALTLTAIGTQAAFAQGDTQLETIERQIKSLQNELTRMKAEEAARDRAIKSAQSHTYAPSPAAMPVIPPGYALVPAGPGATPGSVVLAKEEMPPPAKKLPKGSFEIGDITVTLGGFFEAAGVFRSRNEQTDLASSFTSGIPFRESALYHEPETVLSSRQSRVTAAISADPDSVTHIQGYFAADFLGGAPTANYNQSNSWTPRLREAWIDYARSDWGFYALGGQTWTLLTANKVGVNPLQIDLPLQIDPQYVVGLNWARQTGFRVAKNLGSDQFWIAASIENSATIVSGTAPTITGTTINQSNAGIGVDATGGSFTTNFAPDVIVKATADFDIAHLEAFALGRNFNDRLTTLGGGKSAAVFGGGFGGDALIHIIPKELDFHVSGLVGDGVGRYGTSQLADATYNAEGHPVALPGYSGYAGLIGHPDPANDVYAYFGVEHVDARYDLGLVKGKDTTLAGYGSSLINNSDCNIQGDTAEECSPATSGDAEITVGNWYKFINGGAYGTMEVGLQYSYVRRYVLQGVGPTPKTDENMLFASFRWYPFQ
jgi:hypothetical protein